MIESLLEAERLMAVGLLDQAESRFARILESDPRNSIAAVGLARVAVERGDDAAALELARRAATIDPENPAAAGMVVRLEEVLGAPARGTAGPIEAGATTRAPGADASAPHSEPSPRPEAPPAIPRPASPSSTESPSPQAKAHRPAPAPRRRRRRSLLGRILGRG